MEFPKDVYERSPYRADVPFDQLTSTSDAYKKIREKFVTGFSGSNKYEACALVLVTPVSIYMHQLIIGYLVSISPWFRRLRNSQRDDKMPEGLTYFEHFINLLIDTQLTCLPSILIVFYTEYLTHFFAGSAVVYFIIFCLNSK